MSSNECNSEIDPKVCSAIVAERFKNLESKIDNIAFDIRNIKQVLNGNGNRDGGLIGRVAILEQGSAITFKTAGWIFGIIQAIVIAFLTFMLFKK